MEHNEHGGMNGTIWDAWGARTVPRFDVSSLLRDGVAFVAFCASDTLLSPVYEGTVTMGEASSVGSGRDAVVDGLNGLWKARRSRHSEVGQHRRPQLSCEAFIPFTCPFDIASRRRRVAVGRGLGFSVASAVPSGSSARFHSFASDLEAAGPRSSEGLTPSKATLAPRACRESRRVATLTDVGCARGLRKRKRTPPGQPYNIPQDRIVSAKYADTSSDFTAVNSAAAACGGRSTLHGRIACWT